MAVRKKCIAKLVLIILGIIFVAGGLLGAYYVVRSLARGIEQNNCLPTSKVTKNFENWVSESRSKVSVYFWDIQNKNDFLYKGQNPKFEERGPYIYTKTTKKISVIFQPGIVSYKQYIRHEFDVNSTQEKCPTCKESDQITVLNMGYIGLMSLLKGDQKFAMLMIPNLIKGYLQKLDAIKGSRNDTLAYLGNVTASMMTSNQPAFGPWLGKNAVFKAGIVNATREGKNYNITEMNGLYTVLMSPTLLLPSSSPVDPFSKGAGLLTYLTTHLNLSQTLKTMPSTVNKTAYIEKLRQVETNMNDILCTNSSLDSCFYIMADDVLTVQALFQFITTYLAAVSMAFLDDNNYGLIVTRPVKDLAFGYIMTKLAFPPLYPSGVPVPGVLVNHTNEADAEKKNKYKALYTCESRDNIPSTWAGYDSKAEIPSGYFPGASSDQLKVKGFDRQFTTTEKLSPCTNKYPRTADHFDVFISAMYQRVRFTYDKQQTIHGIHLHRYILDEQNFKVNNITVFVEGIVDLSNARGIPASVSGPGFLYGHPILHQQLSLSKPTFEKYGNIMDIEPITGRPMNVELGMQINSVIIKDFISAPRLPPLNVTFYDITKPYVKQFPVFWLKTGGRLSKEDAEFLNKKLFSNFVISCSVSVILPIIGGLMLLIAIILIAMSFKKSSRINNGNIQSDDC